MLISHGFRSAFAAFAAAIKMTSDGQVTKRMKRWARPISPSISSWPTRGWWKKNWHCSDNENFNDTLWWTYKKLWKITIFNGKIHYFYGELSHSNGKIHNAINGKIHYFYGHFQWQTVSSPEGMFIMIFSWEYHVDNLWVNGTWMIINDNQWMIINDNQ